jgi:hypothetical protein
MCRHTLNLVSDDLVPVALTWGMGTPLHRCVALAVPE